MGKATIYLQLLDGLAGMDLPDEVKQKYEEMIRMNAAMNGVTAIDRPERVRYARHLLDLKEPRPAICQRLMTKYEIGRSQAYKVIQDAL